MPCIENSSSYCSGVSSAWFGTRELDAQDERLETARDEKDEGGDDVADPDLLVVDSRDPAEKPRLRRPNPLERAGDRRLVVRADDLRDAIVFGGGHACFLTSA